MNKFTIYCTPEQTRKALELGAPIEYAIVKDVPNTLEVDGVLYKFPTAEQMIGWLEEQGMQILSFASILNYWSCFCYTKETKLIFQGKWVSSRKEATLAAIDAALDYVLKKTKQL